MAAPDDEMLDKILQRIELLDQDAQERIRNGASTAEMAPFHQARAALVQEYVTLFNRQPYSPFNTLESSAVLDGPALELVEVVEGKLPSVRLKLASLDMVVPAVVALLNSGRRGELTLPVNVTQDQLCVELARIQPRIDCAEGNRNGGRSSFTMWQAGSGGCHNGTLYVVPTSNTLHFWDVKVRRRGGDIGQQLSLSAVLNKLSDISPAHLNAFSSAKVHSEDVGRVDHLKITGSETDMKEDKESAWWASDKFGDEPAAIGFAVSGRRLAQVLDEHVKQTMVEMYELPTKGKPVIACLSFGVRDCDRVAVGVPVDGNVQAAQQLVQSTIAKSMARLFPAPPLSVDLQWSELNTAASKRRAMCATDGRLLVALGQKAVRVVAQVAAWVLAVRCDGQLGAIFSLAGDRVRGSSFIDNALVVTLADPDVVTDDRYNETTNSCGKRGKSGQSDKGEKQNKTGQRPSLCIQGIGCWPAEEVTILPHFLVKALMVPHPQVTDEQVISSALFRNGAFDCAGYLQADSGDGCPQLFRFSPFAVWAFLQHRGQPSAVWRHARRAYSFDVFVLAGDGIPTEDIVPPSGIKFTSARDVPVPSATRRQQLVLLGFDADQVRPLLMNGRRLVMLDTNPVRLQKAVKEVLDRGCGRVLIDDAGLFATWEALNAHDDLSTAQLTQRAQTLLPPPDNSLPSATSADGRKLIRNYLAGSGAGSHGDGRPTDILYHPAYLNAATMARTDEEDVLVRPCQCLVAGQVKHFAAHAVFRGAGTVTLLQRVAMRLRQANKRVRAEVVRAQDAERIDCTRKLLQSWHENGVPKDVGCIVILIVDSDNTRRVATDLKNGLAQLVQSNLTLQAAVFEVVVHGIFDVAPFTGNHLVLGPVLHVKEREELSNFVQHFSGYFPNKAKELAALQIANAELAARMSDQIFIGLPGLIVSGFHHSSCLATVQNLLARDDEGDMLGPYLAKLALLELFAEEQMPGPLPGVRFEGDWDWLLTQCDERHHRLQAFIFAVPLLRATLGVSVVLEQNGLRFLGGQKMLEKLPDYLLSAFRTLAKTEMSLMVYLRKLASGNSGDRMPHWIQVLKQISNSDDCAIELLSELLGSWPPTSEDHMRRSRLQACILLAQLLVRNKRWVEIVDIANEMVKTAEGTNLESLSRANRASVFSDLVAMNASTNLFSLDRLHDFVRRCDEDFTLVLGGDALAHHFDARNLLRKAVGQVLGPAQLANMDQHHPATMLFNVLAEKLGEESPMLTTDDFQSPQFVLFEVDAQGGAMESRHVSHHSTAALPPVFAEVPRGERKEHSLAVVHEAEELPAWVNQVTLTQLNALLTGS